MVRACLGYALSCLLLVGSALLGHTYHVRKPLNDEARLKKNGLTVIKGYKMCGSTFVGALWRMTKKHDVPLGGTGQVPRRNLPATPGSYFITMVRDPGERCLSELYYNRGHGGKGAATEEETMTKLSEGCDDSFETKFLGSSPKKSVVDIFNSYDFVAVCERFDESLLLMGKKFGFSLPDMLYLKAKESGHWSDLGHDGKTVAMPGHESLSRQSKKVKDSAAGLYEGNDGKLLRIANKALDRAVLKYGESQMKKDLKRFNRMQREVEDICRKDFRDRCLRREVRHHDGAIHEDCGQACINELVEARGWE